MMRQTLLTVVICLGLGLPGFAMAKPPVADEIAVRMISDYVIPHYADLAVATEMQQRSWQDGCDDPETLRAAYHDVADAWARTYFWNTGPITLLLRHDRFYHWPERRNAVSRGMTALLASEDEARLVPQHFATDSVAVQGLSALEYLLFSKADVQNNDYACKVGQAIAANLNEIAQGTAAEWQDKVLPLLEAGAPHPLYFDDAQELANNLYTDYLAGFTIIKDQKVLAVMGASADQARPKKAEAARSDRSLRNIIVNLDGLAAGAVLWAGLAGDEQVKQVQALFGAARQELVGLDDYADALTGEAGRAQLTRFVTALTAAQAYMAQDLVNDLGLHVGFNSLDGD